MEAFLDPNTINPNVVYLALIVGLWVGITAIYVPGTGIPEVVALVLLGGSMLVLTVMATNWLAVVLIVIGITGFLLVPFVNPHWARYAEAGLILQGIGGFLLFEDQPISVILVALTLITAILYHRLVLLPIMRTQQQKPVSSDESLIGKVGRVAADIDPVGTVHVNNELWTARSKTRIGSGTHVLVISRDGLELQVEKAKRQESDDKWLSDAEEKYNELT